MKGVKPSARLFRKGIGEEGTELIDRELGELQNFSASVFLHTALVY
jgi:hypothetical protein